MSSSRTRPRRIAAWILAALVSTGPCNPAFAGDDVIDVGNAVPTPDTIQQGLFPDDECEQLKAAGFKCMGFKPPVRFSLPAVSFRVGSAELPDELMRQLDAFAAVLRTRQDTARKVRVEGHADATGDPASNMALSQRRADAARQYLVGKGVPPELLKAVGLGDQSPKDARNPTAAENRRVVIGRDGETPRP